jgi:hypothetical protein
MVDTAIFLGAGSSNTLFDDFIHSVKNCEGLLHERTA